jgi:hypothetical protein
VAALNVPACLGKSNFCLQATLRKLFTQFVGLRQVTLSGFVVYYRHTIKINVFDFFDPWMDIAIPSQPYSPFH